LHFLNFTFKYKKKKRKTECLACVAGTKREGKEEKIIRERGARVKGEGAPPPSSRPSRL